MHFQVAPNLEAKIVRCIRVRVWDVVVDLRQDSLTYKKWFAVELAGEKHNSIFVPEGCAHGFQPLELDSTLLYVLSAKWSPVHEKGLRWNDPELSIDWPIALTKISERDVSLPFIQDL